MSPTAWRWAVVAAISVAAVMGYVNTLEGQWVWDDVSSVLLHKHLQDPDKFLQLFQEDQHKFGRGQGNFYRPLVSASFMLDYAITGGPLPSETEAAGKSYPEVPPLVFHLSNMLWHLLAALFLFTLLLRIGAPLIVGTAATLVYVAHPLHTEAVAYISGRADMMSATFMFAGICLVFVDRTGSSRWATWALSLLCFIFALMSKESSLIHPVLLLIVVLAGELSKNKDARRYRDKLPPILGAAILLVVYIILRSTVLKFAEATSTATAPLGQRLQETCQAYALYIKMLFWPTHLHMERTLDGVPAWVAGIGAVLLAFTFVCIAMAWGKKQYRIAAGLIWFVAAWLPISGIFPLNAPMAEHWMYVPMAGFWWATAETMWILCDRPGMRWVPLTTAFAACAVLLILTAQRNKDWHDNDRLFVATLKENPKSVRVQYNLAVTYEDITKNYSGALRHYEAVARLQSGDVPGVAKASFVDPVEIALSIGHVYEKLGNPVSATNQYQKIIKIGKANDPSLTVDAALGMGRCLIAMGEWANASVILAQLAEKLPDTRSTVDALLARTPLSESF